MLDATTKSHELGNSSVDLTSVHKNNASSIEYRISKIPQTRFYGSKRRLLNWIHESTRSLEFSSVLDAFGGTASVSLLFKLMGKRVTYNDGLLSNLITAKAVLSSTYPLENVYQASELIDSIKPLNGFISKTFQGMYYKNEENNWLDGALTTICKINNESERNAYLYALFQACLKKRPFNLFHRNNLNLRLNDVERSFGNFTTWETDFSIFMKSSLVDLRETPRSVDNEVIFLPPGDVSKLSAGYDLVYLDPPYISESRGSDDYLRRYHFLEGLSNYEQWENLIDYSTKLKELYRRSYIKDWQDKSKFKDLLFDLIKNHSNSIVVLSYVAGAFPSEDEITNYLKSKFKKVRVLRKELNHALAKQKKTELLFIGSQQ